MQRDEGVSNAVLEKLREFDRVATLLEMPRSERLGILNVSEEVYLGLRSSGSSFITHVKPELERRLSYALPLMRRLASSTPPAYAAAPAPSIRASA